MRSHIFRSFTIFAMLFSWWCGFDARPLFGQGAKPIRDDGRLEFFTPNGDVAATIIIEIVDTPLARGKGLMGNRTLDDTMGMLFVYGREGNRVFWMRNTRMSLDILFISKNRKVINIAKQTRPMSDTRYFSEAPAQYVVEVISGFCDRYGIKKGHRVKWVRK